MDRKVKIEDSWHLLLSEEFKKPYFNQIREFIRCEYQKHTIYPKGSDIFRAFNLTPLDSVKGVIIGQDPYHGPGHAHGLCFSLKPGIDTPPSLKNIYKEINSDLGIEVPKTGYLQRWAEQGVLMLNNVLTVRKGKPNSHKNSGWEIFTAKVIEKISREKEGIVFFLWGNSAQKKENLIDSRKHLVLKAPHPSPLSAYNGFFGCRHFSKSNNYLISKNKKPIDWKVVK